MNTLFRYDRSFALMANNRRKSRNTWRASYSDLTLHWLGGWVSKLTSIWWGKEQIVQVKVFDAISHLLTNFEIQRYDQNEHQFNIQEIFLLKKYSRNNSLTIKNEIYVYVINFDECEKAETYCLVIPVLKDKITSFDNVSC